ncbi:MAG: methylmalonyl-CoA mutase family protein, partial [Myxococcota bacterium]
DQQWSLRAQQILAFESDLLEFEDLFNGSKVVEQRTRELVDEAWAEVQEVLDRGGAVRAVESGYIKQRLVESNAERLRAIETGEQIVVGVNGYTETEPSPLTASLDEAILTVKPEVEKRQIAALEKWRAQRDEKAVEQALGDLKKAAESDENIMAASIAAAHAGVTTGEWGFALREVFGEYRAPTGVAGARVTATGDGAADELQRLRGVLGQLEKQLGRRPKFLVGKPGLDGHSNGAEQIAIKARDVGFDVVYEGIRVTPEQLVASAIEEGVHLIGLSILSGSHLELVPVILDQMKGAGLGDVPVVVGGIIPEADASRLEKAGVTRVYTPKDFALNTIMTDLVGLVAKQADAGHAS